MNVCAIFFSNNIFSFVVEPFYFLCWDDATACLTIVKCHGIISTIICFLYFLFFFFDLIKRYYLVLSLLCNRVFFAISPYHIFDFWDTWMRVRGKGKKDRRRENTRLRSYGSMRRAAKTFAFLGIIRALVIAYFAYAQLTDWRVCI